MSSQIPWIRVLDIVESEDPDSKRLTFFWGNPQYFKSNMYRVEIRQKGTLLADFEFCQANMNTLLDAIGLTTVKKEWKQKIEEAISLLKDIKRLTKAIEIFEELSKIEKQAK